MKHRKYCRFNKKEWKLDLIKVIFCQAYVTQLKITQNKLNIDGFVNALTWNQEKNIVVEFFFWK